GRDWDPETMARGIERTLRRLRTDHLDLLQLHSCDEERLRQGDVIDVLQRARESGKTRYIGYSGDGDAALFAVKCGAFDALQTSINIADQEALDLTLPEANRRGIGVIAKRPVANVAWGTGSKPASAYHHTYWERLRALQYPFVERAMAAVGSGEFDAALSDSVGTALRFTLGCEAVATAIVGTRNPRRWADNARLLAAGPLPAGEFAAIRARWKEVSQSDWRGQT
ncbi:MAG: aldo/keto reductase, partial [Firmicutes bacterium]|nr:aldo/keto reductase [Bacillota bacterium]